VRVDKEYSFDTDEGTRTAQLFDGRPQLLAYHVMFGPEYTKEGEALRATSDRIVPQRVPQRRSLACQNGKLAQRTGLQNQQGVATPRLDSIPSPLR
jgi:hypothetical protein